MSAFNDVVAALASRGVSQIQILARPDAPSGPMRMSVVRGDKRYLLVGTDAEAALMSFLPDLDKAVADEAAALKKLQDEIAAKTKTQPVDKVETP
jgi:methylmalonyl-CoA mutase cobalamin-binding subunit